MLKSHLLHMAHLGGIRHLHKNHLHKHGHGAYGSHQKKGYGDFEDVARGHMNYMRNKALIGHGTTWDNTFGKNAFKNASSKRKMGQGYIPKHILDESKKHMVLPLSGSGSKHIKPLKFKM